MGLSRGSVGRAAVPGAAGRQPSDGRVMALAGNPNVGKSTLFNALTGMNQHTGNWPGKTVGSAEGRVRGLEGNVRLVDLPGTYSLMAHSEEETAARDFLCFERPDCVVVVCDATCLERNLNLVLQVLELTERVIVCVNLMDEAARKGIRPDLKRLSGLLGVPVVGVTARKRRSLAPLLSLLREEGVGRLTFAPPRLCYPEPVEAALGRVLPAVERCPAAVGLPARWLGLRLLEGDPSLAERLRAVTGADEPLAQAVRAAREELAAQGIDGERLRDLIVSALAAKAEQLGRAAVSGSRTGYDGRDRRLDRLLTGRAAGYPAMLLLLAAVFWLTIVGSNAPSRLLSDWLFRFQDVLTALFRRLGAPEWLHGALVLGAYRVLAWVVSVMLPPMAIFFPLFTLLEDAGYLPRVAFLLDRPFHRCRACGKQALCMAMGFGCNAAGVVGCRIIDSPRERMLAVLTNSLVPCNGRFPTLIAVLSMFFIGAGGGALSSLLSAVLLTALVALAVGMTFAATGLLSKTVLKGVPSFFTLELPPYRPPQLGQVLLRSVLDRTLFVLGRAAAVAAPAGLLIWLAGNIYWDGESLLRHCAAFLDPFARLMGLDGVLLLAFVLGLPANEIVLPLAVMGYLAQGSLQELGNLQTLRELLVQNGWTWGTAGSVLLFTLFHWPCSTTLLTVKKETGSWKWAGLAFLLPAGAGVGLCMLFTALLRLAGA